MEATNIASQFYTRNYIAYEFKAECILEILKHNMNDPQFIGLLFSHHSGAVIEEGTLSTSVDTSTNTECNVDGPIDFWIDHVFLTQSPGTTQVAFTDRVGGFLGLRAENILVYDSAQNKYVRSATAEGIRDSDRHQYHRESNTSFGFCYLSKVELFTIARNSEKIIISGAQINLGHSAFPRSGEPSTGIYTYKFEGDMANSDSNNQKYTIQQSRPNKRKTAFLAHSKTASISEALLGDQPAVIVGLPCPTAWVGVGHTDDRSAISTWRSFVNQKIHRLNL